MTEKLRVLVKVSYGAFDARHETPIAVSANVELLKEMASLNNSRLTKEEIRNEMHYEVTTDLVKHLA